ncbi:LOW QUALITY PROTEIN: olfactory receptor 10H2-like [Rhynochetos jubatus]
MRRDDQNPRGFVSTGSSRFPELRVAPSVLFLLTCEVTLAGTVIRAVIRDRGPRAPAYLLRGALSSGLCHTSSIAPEKLSGSAPGDRVVSLLGCAAQTRFSFAWARSSLLTAMGYDRRLVVASWLGGGLLGLLVTCAVCQLPSCRSHQMDRFFCPPLRLPCAGGEGAATVATVPRGAARSGCLLPILPSYAFIPGRPLWMPSAVGRHKTFSPCASHVAVGAERYGCASSSTRGAARAGALLDVSYALFTPLLSPLGFSLRNKGLKNALWKSPRTSFVVGKADLWPGSRLSSGSRYRRVCVVFPVGGSSLLSEEQPDFS